MREGERKDDRKGRALRGLLFRAWHFLYLHSPVQSFFGNHPGGRGLFLLSSGGRGRVLIYGLLKDIFSWM